MFPKVSNPFPQNPDTFCPGLGFSHLHPLLLQVQLDTLHFVQSSGWSQKIIFWLGAFSLIMFHVNWHPVLKDNSLNFSPDFIKQTLLSSNILYFHPKLPYSFRRYFILAVHVLKDRGWQNLIILWLKDSLTDESIIKLIDRLADWSVNN